MSTIHFSNQQQLAFHQELQRFIEVDGVLSQHFAHYQQRAGQQQMLQAVAEHLVTPQPLVIEAGTGVGKTFAYLLPNLLALKYHSQRRLIISTASKNLQTQLYQKDLPSLLPLLGFQPKLALLKGRNNYLCQLRLKEQMHSADNCQQQVLDELLKIYAWSQITTDGDLEQLTTVRENAAALEFVRSRKDLCPAKECEYYQACFTRKARLKAQQAQVIVVNHHLYFADRLLKDQQFQELLPAASQVIFDEAHTLPDLLVDYFAKQTSSSQLLRLLNHIEQCFLETLPDTTLLGQGCQQAMKALLQWLLIINQQGRSDWRHYLAQATTMQCTWHLIACLETLVKVMQGHQHRSQWLDELCPELQQQLEFWQHFAHCESHTSVYQLQFFGHFREKQTLKKHVQLSIAPIDIAKLSRALFQQTDAQTNAAVSWLFTSATLQHQGKLDHFCRQLGLKKAQQQIVASPFNYQQQAVFCVPRALSHVYSESMGLKQLVDICVQAAEAADGRMFVLFTSLERMQAVADNLRRRLIQPVLVQGQMGKAGLLGKFRQLGNAVLLGTNSFWEGVDMPGRALTCVIIDKLPFPVPDEPLYQARANLLAQNQGDPFQELSVPQAVMQLKQGVGRLIRDEQDRGVLILCDNRIVNRAYGAQFIASLPPMRRTRDLAKTLTFLKTL